jgi:hypothetical protein
MLHTLEAPSNASPIRALEHDIARRQLDELLTRPDLDAWRRDHPWATAPLEAAVEHGITAAYDSREPASIAHDLLQRTLYRINRMMLFWYDELRAYENERSPYLLALRHRVETAWQAWELEAHHLPTLQREPVRAGLLARAARDVDAPFSPAGMYFRDDASLTAYRRLVAIMSVDGLVEASQLSRTLGGVANDVHATMTRLLLEEYGGGRPGRKHSDFFRTMLESLDMATAPEAYLDLVPWEVLACINHSFLLSDRKRLFLRYVGGLLYTEVSVPSAYRAYHAAGERLGLPRTATAYWDLHVKEDARHGPWMLHDVALPLAARYPEDAWELLLGYDQQRRLSARAGAATARAAASAT